MTKKLAPFTSSGKLAGATIRRVNPAPPVDEAALRAVERAGDAQPTERTVAYLPVDVSNRLRIVAATERLSLSSAVTEAVREWLQKRP